MSAAWVLCLIVTFTGQQVPVVKAQDPLAPPEPPAGLVPTSFQPADRLDAPGLPLDLFGLTNSTWYAQLETIFWNRTLSDIPVGYHLGAVAINNGVPPNFVDLNQADTRAFGTQDLDFSSKPGLRFLVGRTIWVDPCDDRGCVAKPEEMPDALRSLSLELGYLGLLQKHQASVYYAAHPNTPEGALVSRFGSPGPANTLTPVLWPFDQASIASLVYRSRFDSAELNLRYATSASKKMPLDLLAGVRFVKLQENLDYLAASNVFLNTTVPSQAGLYSTRTDNDLIGLQVGGDLSYRLSSAFSLTGRSRGGLLVNSASQRSNVNGTLMATSLPYGDIGAANSVGLAGLFEFGIQTNYQLSQNLTLHVGYQGLFLSDLSTAPRQLNWNTEYGGRNGLDRNGNLFFFGPAAGIEWKW